MALAGAMALIQALSRLGGYAGALGERSYHLAWPPTRVAEPLIPRGVCWSQLPHH
jgi:hypothetical protein